MATFNMCSRLVRSVYNANSTALRCSIYNPRITWRGHSGAPETDIKTAETSTKAGQAEQPAADAKATDATKTEAEVALEAEKDKLTAQFSELQDKYKFSLAEMENLRKRMQKQVSDAKLFGIQGFCKDLLEVADILGTATEAVPQAELQAGSQTLKDLFSGLSMTESQLQKVFTRHGLQQIDPSEGDTFNPNIHEALFQLPVVEGKGVGTVGAITKIGYKLHDRTIRPALVGVYK